MGEEHEEENAKRLEEAKTAGGDDPAKWEEELAAIEQKCKDDHEAADAMQAEQDANKTAFEENCAKELSTAVEVRDAAVARLEKAEEENAAKKEQAYADAEKAKE